MLPMRINGSACANCPREALFSFVGCPPEQPKGGHGQVSKGGHPRCFRVSNYKSANSATCLNLRNDQMFTCLFGSPLITLVPCHSRLVPVSLGISCFCDRGCGAYIYTPDLFDRGNHRTSYSFPVVGAPRVCFDLDQEARIGCFCAGNCAHEETCVCSSCVPIHGNSQCNLCCLSQCAVQQIHADMGVWQSFPICSVDAAYSVDLTQCFWHVATWVSFQQDPPRVESFYVPGPTLQSLPKWTPGGLW